MLIYCETKLIMQVVCYLFIHWHFVDCMVISLTEWNSGTTQQSPFWS